MREVPYYMPRVSSANDSFSDYVEDIGVDDWNDEPMKRRLFGSNISDDRGVVDLDEFGEMSGRDFRDIQTELKHNSKVVVAEPVYERVYSIEAICCIS